MVPSLSETDDRVMGSMHMDADVRGRIDNYLAEADAALARRGVPSVERRSVEVSLRNRILGALRVHPSERDGAPDVEAVLTSLGPPDQTLDAGQLVHPAAARDAVISTGSSGQPVKLSWLAVIGAMWAAAFFAVLAVAAASSNGLTSDAGSSWRSVNIAILMRVGWSAPFATTVIGLIALERIRRSNGLKQGGRQYGLSLALFDVMLFPLLLINILIILTCNRLSELIFERQWMSPEIAGTLFGQILPAVACILGSYWIVTRAWASLTASPAVHGPESVTTISPES